MKSTKKPIGKITMLAFMPAVVLTFTSCSSTPVGQTTTAATYESGVPGGIFVRTFKNSATVTAIDKANRKVTLVSPDGRKATMKCGPEVINFDQIQLGDQVKATQTEELVVSLAAAGSPPSQTTGALVVLSPEGAKPGGVVAETTQVTARVKAIDLKNHKVTLQFPDGTTKTFPVRQDVDLTQQKVGAEVNIQRTEAVAIIVEKP